MKIGLLCTLFVAFLLSMLAWSASADVSGNPVEIIIKERSFIPAIVSLTLDMPVHLFIRNQDHDLHAFVPLLLFQGTNVQVTGNSAAEFNDTGLARVLIPPQGYAELSFRPKHPGVFFYICDLPGHQMRGEIIVAGDH